ncbi:MAG: hypothetical protein E6G93_04195 [Alphaproteobacteria bacterium]|nr:MAG: hypothetical protein E6G93_04195 [Alphaproteobacteria bacterium]
MFYNDWRGSQQASLLLPTSLRGALATKQSRLPSAEGFLDCFASLAMTGNHSRRPWSTATHST